MNRKPASGSTLTANLRAQALETKGRRRWFHWGSWEQRLLGLGAIVAAAATGLNLGLVEQLERQAQTLFFETRGMVAPPDQIVVLAIDEVSLSQGEFFRADPQKYSSLAPIESWPWQRTAYATAIDRLMAAGAKAVAIDVMFSTPSIYGEADDQRFAQTLQQHQNRVVLAARYSQTETAQGLLTQLITPLPQFCDRSNCTGFINFLLEPDSQIHQLGSSFLTQLLQDLPETQAQAVIQAPSLAEATLKAAQTPYTPPKGSSIFFYGPEQTFKHIPFWTVLDPKSWKDELQSGAYFKDKIVLIGSTAAVHQDFHASPFSDSWLYPQPMPGVEIHANAIATLMQGTSIAEAIPSAPLRGLLVLVGMAIAGGLLSRPQQPLRRLAWAMVLAGSWLGVSYGLFVWGHWIVPTAVPVGVIVLGGLTQLVFGLVKEQLRKRRLRDTLKQYVTSPIVQEIISQQDDLQDLLHDRELALAGKVLGGRYRIARVLGSGGFSETYIAKDLQRPGQPLCVVKQLRMVSNNPNTLKQARRLFATEAETLERLGYHEQIPQLLASFEENHEFYLVQEFIQGHALLSEIIPQRSLPESKVVRILDDLLNILAFVHDQGVIHRDLKPSNIIRRRSDQRLVLIDFGIAKKITTQLAEGTGETRYTIAVGTPGYMPSEQSAGRPQINSDIYALGMMAIEALTGQAPHTLSHDPKTGDVRWTNQAQWVNPTLALILTKMVHHDFTQRYQSVQQVQADLAPLINFWAVPDDTLQKIDSAMSADAMSAEDIETVDYDSEEADAEATIPLPEDWIK